VRVDLAQKLETSGFNDGVDDPIFREENGPLTSTIQAIGHAHELIGDPCTTCPRRGPGAGGPALRYVF
jgi:hypothetical protein